MLGITWNFIFEDPDSILNLLSFTETILLFMGFEVFASPKKGLATSATKQIAYNFDPWVKISAWHNFCGSETTGTKDPATRWKYT